MTEPDVVAEPEIVLEAAEPEPAKPEPEDVEVAAPAAPVAYGTSLDEPPPGTEPIARSADVTPGDAVVAYIRGRWQDSVVVRRSCATRVSAA